MSSAWDVGSQGRYTYESLQDQPSNTIRLISLKPGDKNDTIRCDLTTVQLSRSFKYSALSYVWGEQQRSLIILVNGKTLRIGVNLWYFLKRIRHPVLGIRIWTDAICINQQDLNERGHQVRLMGDIYRNAYTVFAWLGEDTHGARALLGTAASTQTFRALVMDHEAITENSAGYLGWDESRDTATLQPYDVHIESLSHTADDSFKSRNSPIVPKFHRIPTHDQVTFTTARFDEVSLRNSIFDQIREMAWVNFEDLCKRKFWKRTWVVQELLLAQSVVICIGDIQIMWDDISAMMEFWTQKFQSLVNEVLAQEADLIHSFIQLMKTSGAIRHRPLGTLLTRYRAQECLDPRDKVYAMLSLATDCEGVEPDYTKNRLDLFFELGDIVDDHSTLRSSLGIPVDEIQYRAEILGLKSYAEDEHICVLPNGASDWAWAKRKLRMQCLRENQRRERLEQREQRLLRRAALQGSGCYRL